jgi:hypothetical protein
MKTLKEIKNWKELINDLTRFYIGGKLKTCYQKN